MAPEAAGGGVWGAAEEGGVMTEGKEGFDTTNKETGVKRCED